MDPYVARHDVIQKMLPEKLETLSHNTNICDTKTNNSDVSDSDYVLREHFDQEECDHVSTRETTFDGDNVTASNDSDTDSATGGGHEAKNGKIWNKLPPLVSRCRKCNIVIGES
jgi:hypothetical protein